MRTEKFFQSTGFIRTTLVPVLVLTGVGLWFLVPEWTVGRFLLIAALSSTMLLYAAALMWPDRMWWAGRAVAGMVFGFYAWYAIFEWFFTDHAFRLVESSSRSSPRNALLGLFFIGLPSLFYALRGPRSAAEDEDPSDDDEDAEARDQPR